jgi:hypothetical protein
MTFVASNFLTSTYFFRPFHDNDSVYGLSLMTMWLTSTTITLLYAAAAKEKVSFIAKMNPQNLTKECNIHMEFLISV